MTNQIIIKMVLDAWHSKIKEADTIFDSLTDEQLLKEVAPGRNTGIYLLGHLTAIHDALHPLLGLGKKLHPELEEIFVNNPDNSSLTKPPLSDLKTFWFEVNNNLSEHFNQFT